MTRFSHLDQKQIFETYSGKIWGRGDMSVIAHCDASIFMGRLALEQKPLRVPVADSLLLHEL